MQDESRKVPQRSENRKRQRNHAKRQSNWLSGVAILIAVVLGYLVMQTQKRLETVQSELHKVSENAVQAKARVVDLEQTAAGLKRELKRADFKRNELQDQLNKENSKIKQLSEIVEAAEASQDNWRTRSRACEAISKAPNSRQGRLTQRLRGPRSGSLA